MCKRIDRARAGGVHLAQQLRSLGPTDKGPLKPQEIDDTYRLVFLDIYRKYGDLMQRITDVYGTPHNTPTTGFGGKFEF